MTTEIELLPLPEGYDKYSRPLLYGEQMFHEGQMRAYARANIAHATAPLQAEIEALRAEVAMWERVASAHAELHGEAEARAERLAEALRELEEREQRDEALLRQALEVLSRAHKAAMEQTLKARIPECAEFAGIAQDLDFVVAALRERLGVKA